ncbi:hypothetical protein TNCV_1204531 [Trichonephila clavipes]|nr:hypothetical protein TNCV_1204531 [Trichonephila clavipes]
MNSVETWHEGHSGAFSKQQMPVCEASMANAKTSQFDISSSQWHEKWKDECYDRFQSAVCYPTADSMIPSRS